MEMVLSAILVLVVLLIFKGSEKREKRKKEILDYAIALIEEGIAYSETETKIAKIEAAHNAGTALKKEPVAISKDPIAATRYLNAAMEPMRTICHEKARHYILTIISSLKDKDMKKGIIKAIGGDIDLIIKLRIIASKIGNIDPVKPIVYRNLVC